MITQTAFHLSSKTQGLPSGDPGDLGSAASAASSGRFTQSVRAAHLMRIILEGSDDMPAHAKCSLFGVSLTIPITNGKLNLGHGRASTSVSSETTVAHVRSLPPFMDRPIFLFLRCILLA